MKVSKQRLEALSDGIIAIIITIMVLNIQLPNSFKFNSMLRFILNIAIYFVSFIVVGYFWSRHHMMFRYIEMVTRKIVWYNLLFLFFLSLTPIFSKWVMENPGNLVPAIGYDIVYVGTTFLQVALFRLIIKNSEHESIIRIKDRPISMPEDMRRTLVHRFLGTAAAILIIIIVSVFFQLSSYVLVGLPVIFSVINLAIDKLSHHWDTGESDSPQS